MATTTTTTPAQPTATQSEKGTSFTDGWLEFDAEHQDFFSKDLPHYGQDRRWIPLFAKLRQKSEHASIQLKPTLTRTIKKNPNLSGYKKISLVQEEINLFLNLPKDRTLWVRSSKGNFKLHYDPGLINIGEIPYIGVNAGKFNFFAALSGSWKLSNFAYRAGCKKSFSGFGIDGENDLRIRVNVGAKETSTYFYDKLVLNYNSFTTGILGVYDLTRGYVQKNDLFLKYKFSPRSQVCLSLFADGFRSNPFGSRTILKNYFDAGVFSFLHKLQRSNPITFGARFIYNIKENKFDRAEFVGEYGFGNGKNPLKLKINTLSQFSGVFTRNYNEKSSYSLGAQYGSKGFIGSLGFNFDL